MAMNPLEEFKKAIKSVAGITEPTVVSNETTTTISKVCDISGVEYKVEVPTVEYNAWKNGAFASRVFTNLTVEQCEFLISGTTPEEWKDIFKDEDNN